jgi:uncharacterized Ntn-hydrolase superfamily protein
MTYSIVATCPETGHRGIALASRFFAAGALVPYIRGNLAAVASQAFINPLWGLESVERLARGESGEEVVADLVRRDAGEAHRQIHMIDARGRVAAHTGTKAVDWAGHVAGEGVSVAGNMLAGPRVVEETLRAFQASPGPLAERLMTAMEAGAAAGGDKRGTQSAALRVHRGEDYPWFDLRADDHPDPLAELRRLYAVAHERYVFICEAMGTRDNFSGAVAREHIDLAIARAEAAREARGEASLSFARAPATILG